MLLSPLFLFDLQNIATLFRKEIHPTKKSNDYTILIPVHKRKLDPLLEKQILEIRDKIIIVDDSKGDKFMKGYLSSLRDWGIKIIKKEGEGFKWSALKNALNYVTTKYVIFLDDDTYSEKDFEYLAGTLEHEKADIASVNVYPTKTKTVMEKLQNIEYRIAMLGRQNRPWITSGACIVSKTHIMKDILENHSGFRDGGDIEIGLLAKRKKFKVIHLEYDVYTEVPSTFREWFSQRYKWMGGNFRHVVVNIFSGGRDSIYLFYFFILLWTHILVRYYLLFEYPGIFFLIMGIYAPLTYIGNIKIRKHLHTPLLFIFPVYAIFQIMVLSIFGIFSYFYVAIKQRNFGFINKFIIPR